MIHVNTPNTNREGQLRVWHIPQVPMSAFYVYVDNLKEAKLILEVLAKYDLFQYENNVKPDYSNASGLQVYSDSEGYMEWEDEYGEDIFKTGVIK